VSIRDQIAPLEELSALDVDLKRVEDLLEKHTKGLSGMRSEVKELEDRVKGDRETVAAMDKTRNDLMSELRQMTQQIERSREKLSRSRNERESNAAQREMEELRKLHRDREEDLERLSNAADSAKTAIDDAEKKRVAVSSELDGSADGIATSMSELTAEKKRLGELRARAVARLPVVIYRRYETIRTRRPVAIARTHDGTCLGCQIAVPPAMFQKMRRQQEFEQCPQCRRILYYVPLDASPASSPDPSR
jgi:predicted  nucleic acid-binding Zn-ribbon protein